MCSPILAWRDLFFASTSSFVGQQKQIISSLSYIVAEGAKRRKCVQISGNCTGKPLIYVPLNSCCNCHWSALSPITDPLSKISSCLVLLSFWNKKPSAAAPRPKLSDWWPNNTSSLWICSDFAAALFPPFQLSSSSFWADSSTTHVPLVAATGLLRTCYWALHL